VLPAAVEVGGAVLLLSGVVLMTKGLPQDLGTVRLRISMEGWKGSCCTVAEHQFHAVSGKGDGACMIDELVKLG
jgi:hypothetical protein